MLYSAGNTVKCDLSQQKKTSYFELSSFWILFLASIFWEKKKTHKNECEVGNHKLSNRLFGGGFVILYTFSFPVFFFFAVFLLFRDFPPIHGALITQMHTHARKAHKNSTFRVALKMHYTICSRLIVAKSALCFPSTYSVFLSVRCRARCLAGGNSGQRKRRNNHLILCLLNKLLRFGQLVRSQAV